MPDIQNMQGKTVLVTGASQGIGAAVAKRYAKAGAHVILLARNTDRLEAVDDAIRADGGTATLIPLDLTNLDAIDPLGALIYERFGKLDVFVANAAVLGELSPLTHTVPKVWDEVITTNLTANYRLLRTLDPLLRAADAAQVLAVTSGVTKGAFPFWGAYSVSKAGLEILFRTYAAEVANTTSITVEIIDPGVVATDMRASAFPGENPESLTSPDEIAERFLRVAA